MPLGSCGRIGPACLNYITGGLGGRTPDVVWLVQLTGELPEWGDFPKGAECVWWGLGTSQLGVWSPIGFTGVEVAQEILGFPVGCIWSASTHPAVTTPLGFHGFFAIHTSIPLSPSHPSSHCLCLCLLGSQPHPFENHPPGGTLSSQSFCLRKAESTSPAPIPPS